MQQGVVNLRIKEIIKTTEMIEEIEVTEVTEAIGAIENLTNNIAKIITIKRTRSTTAFNILPKKINFSKQKIWVFTSQNQSPHLPTRRRRLMCNNRPHQRCNMSSHHNSRSIELWWIPLRMKSLRRTKSMKSMISMRRMRGKFTIRTSHKSRTIVAKVGSNSTERPTPIISQKAIRSLTIREESSTMTSNSNSMAIDSRHKSNSIMTIMRKRNQSSTNNTIIPTREVAIISNIIKTKINLHIISHNHPLKREELTKVDIRRKKITKRKKEEIISVRRSQ